MHLRERRHGRGGQSRGALIIRPVRGLAVLIAITLVGCAQSDGRADTPEALAAELGWRQEAFVLANAGNVAYAGRVRDGALEVIGIERAGAGWRNSMGGDWNGLGGTNTVAINEGVRPGTIMYGSAEPGVARVVTDAPEAVGGQVIDGGWSVWSPDSTLTESDDTVAWQFLAEDGSVVEEGSGWLWPFGGPFDSPQQMP